MHILFLCLTVVIHAVLLGLRIFKFKKNVPQDHNEILTRERKKTATLSNIVGIYSKKIKDLKNEKKLLACRLGGVTKDRNRLFNLLKERVGR